MVSAYKGCPLTRGVRKEGFDCIARKPKGEMFDVYSCQCKLPLFDSPLPSFISRGAGYKSVDYGISNTRPILSERAH